MQEMKNKKNSSINSNTEEKNVTEQERFYGLKRLALCIGLIATALAIRHLVIPALLLSAIAAIGGGILLYLEKKEKQLTHSNFALWGMLLGLAIFLSVILFDIWHF